MEIILLKALTIYKHLPGNKPWKQTFTWLLSDVILFLSSVSSLTAVVEGPAGDKDAAHHKSCSIRRSLHPGSSSSTTLKENTTGWHFEFTDLYLGQPELVGRNFYHMNCVCKWNGVCKTSTYHHPEKASSNHVFVVFACFYFSISLYDM